MSTAEADLFYYSSPNRHLKRDEFPNSFQVILILLFTLLIRLAYQEGMIRYGGNFHNGSDSQKYLDAVNALVNNGIWLDPDRVPFYAAFVALIFKVAGAESLRVVVSVQAVLDTISVAAIAFAARTMCTKMFVPAALVAMIIPNFLVHASYVLQESLFLPFFSGGLFAMLMAYRSRNPVFWLIAAGLLFGVTLWIRISLSYYPVLLLPTVAVGMRISHGFSWPRCALLSLLAPVVMLIVALPLLLYNYAAYGYFALTSQSGGHLLNWFYACLASEQPCSQRSKIVSDIAPLVVAYSSSIGGAEANPFAVSDFMRNLALTRILELPFSQIAWGMIFGALKNLMQTGFYQVFVQFNQPLTFLSATPGSSFVERLQAFFQNNKSNVFMILWAISQTTLIGSRVVQFVGVATGLREKKMRAQTIFLLVTAAYFLLLNGPIADPKYRIPIEPALIILFALGWVRLSCIFKRPSAPTQKA